MRSRSARRWRQSGEYRFGPSIGCARDQLRVLSSEQLEQADGLCVAGAVVADDQGVDPQDSEVSARNQREVDVAVVGGCGQFGQVVDGAGGSQVIDPTVLAGSDGRY
ncbi:MAG: hypothetical protein KJO07_14380 [Deltaproteobacteria bacterium]|nr:hypothetical protein [Deltaproteobacteria bacterium]